MKNLTTTILVLWVASFIGIILTCEELGYTFVLSFVSFGFCSYALRYNSNIVSHKNEVI